MVSLKEKDGTILFGTPEQSNQSIPMGRVKHSLYVRFPKKFQADRAIAKSEVRSLNPKIVGVRIPRQKAANYCLVDFESKIDKQKAAKQLRKIQVDGKHLVVKEADTNDPIKMEKKRAKVEVKREVNLALSQLVGEIKKTLAMDFRRHHLTNGVLIKGIKKGTSVNDVKRSFPDAMEVRITTNPIQKNSLTLIWLPTPKDAKTAAKKKVTINGDEYVVSLQKHNQDDSETAEEISKKTNQKKVVKD